MTRMLSRIASTTSIAFALIAIPAGAFAQQTSVGRFEVGGGLRWLAGVRYRDVNANETAIGGATRALFESSTTFEQAACAEGRVTVRLTSALDAEGSIAYGRSHLTTRLSQDREAIDLTVAEPVAVYVLEGGVAAHPGRWRKGRAAPFFAGGIGYLRQLHEHRTFIENDATAYIGGGLKVALRDGADRSKSTTLRLELRATILARGSALDGATHILPALVAGLSFHL